MENTYITGEFEFDLIPALKSLPDCEYSVWVDGITIMVNGKITNLIFDDPMCYSVDNHQNVYTKFKTKVNNLDIDYLYFNKAKKILGLDVKLQFEGGEYGIEEIASQVPFRLKNLEFESFTGKNWRLHSSLPQKVIEEYNQSLQAKRNV